MLQRIYSIHTTYNSDENLICWITLFLLIFFSIIWFDNENIIHLLDGSRMQSKLFLIFLNIFQCFIIMLHHYPFQWANVFYIISFQNIVSQNYFNWIFSQGTFSERKQTEWNWVETKQMITNREKKIEQKRELNELNYISIGRWNRLCSCVMCFVCFEMESLDDFVYQKKLLKPL